MNINIIIRMNSIHIKVILIDIKKGINHIEFIYNIIN